MEVILLQRIGRLGQMGDVVRVKDGYARNFLLPKGKALRATKENRTRFESMKTELETRNITQRGEAEKVSTKLDGKSFDIAALLKDAGFMVDRSQIELNAPIKIIGLHPVPVALHPEVASKITINVARSADEAERQARGEDLTVRREALDEEEDAGVAAEAFFEQPASDPTGEAGQGEGAEKAD
jgi:large subunit ribosomal protein L9